MKLAEALSIRADLQRRISQLKSRLKDSAKIQEGDTPIEEAEELCRELDICFKQLEEYIFRINRTNMQTLSNGNSLTEMIARKDLLTLRVSMLREIIRYVVETNRFGRNEIRYIRTIDVNKLRKQTDSFAKELRELDLEIQNLNWNIDLL